MAVPEDRRKIWIRLAVIRYGLTVAFAFLALAFWYLQVVQYNRYYEAAENNHQRTLPLRAPRGVLFDRNDRVLVENRESYNISIVREHSKDVGQTLRQLAAVAGVDEPRLQETVRRRWAEPKYRPIAVIEDASLAQVAAVAAHGLDFPDVVVERVPTRQYPTDELAAHLFGYVGEVAQEQRGGGVHAGDVVGQSGLEKGYNNLLMGVDGARKVVVNSAGREIRTLEEVQPTEGRRVQLTIDFDVQRATEEAFRALGYAGAAVVLDPRNGEILSYVSLPAYDPNAFAARGPDFGPTWAALNTDKLRPLQNRAIQGRYAPGSTFKLAVAAAALEEGVITPDFKVHCAGHATFYGRSFKCWTDNAGGHGTVDLTRAIEQSCDVYFYTIGNMLGIDRIHKWATLLGLGEKSGIDLPNEVQGIMPSPEWKRATTRQKWYAGETISVSIGQGQVAVTPISMAVYTATIANGGTRYVPHLVRAIDEGQGWKPRPAPPVRSRIEFKPETLQVLHQSAWLVVNGAGTGGNARIPGKDVAGKTGTAQVVSLEGAKALAGRTDLDLRDNGWFIFFAPRDNPTIAGVVVAEHSGHGTEAARIAHHVLETYFARQDGKPLPPFRAPKPPANAVAAASPGAPRQ
jgi:penicillin-binding protein 2